MIHLLFAFVHLVETTQAASTNSTSSSCHPVASGGTTRTLWGILGSCVLTLIICVWQAVHPNLPPVRAGEAYQSNIITQIQSILVAFLLPEAVVFNAATQWSAARVELKELESRFREKGYLNPWSMTHCLFAGMGGFVYCDESGSLNTIDSLKFFELCHENKIANPVIAEEDIEAFSKSDWIGKTVLVLQLLWFILQAGARHFSGLAITLVELDTLCMAILTIVLVLFCWRKPLRPTCPHMFYSPQCSKTDMLRARMSWKPEPWLHSLERISNQLNDVLQDGRESVYPERDVVPIVALCATWLVFGGVHLTAWNFPFVTKGEKTAWRVASGFLTASPLGYIYLRLFSRWIYPNPSEHPISRTALSGALCYGFLSRFILVILMLYSLRSSPCSAYEVVPWTSYIPHL